MQRILIAIYTHPEAYPPTLNAMSCLAKPSVSIEVLCNNVLQQEWEYPENTQVHALGSYLHIREFESMSILQKFIRWIKFTFMLRQKLRKATLFIAYDPIPLLSYYIASFSLIRKPKLVWYHNHDIIEIQKTRKFSIGWLAAKMEPKAMRAIQLFSLPALERKKYFDLSRFNGNFFFLPNFPLKSFFNQFNSIKKEERFIKIIYQGSIGSGHGLEEICHLLPLTIDNKKLKLVLKGFIKPAYKKELTEIARKRNALASIEFIGITPYQEVPAIAASCHIGIAIFTKQDTMNRTLGTASNKIYEYAACGLPILYYDDEHYRHHLGEYPWAFPTDLSQESIIQTIETIVANHSNLSLAAKDAFNRELNFEKYFSTINAFLSENLEKEVQSMKILLLAGGFGTRLSEETVIKPKPMVEIGGKPILWHIMKGYSAQGFNDFIILLGYKGYLIKEYFANYFLHQSDVTIDLSNNQMEVHNNTSEPWKVTLLDTGLHTMTGGRVLRARDYVNNETFMLTYGDGVANVDIKRLLDFHRQHAKALTMTSVQPAGRFGAIAVDASLQVLNFKEKPRGDGNWINGGFFVCEPKVFDYIAGDATVFEREPLESLAKEGELYTYRHHGFWQCMDTLRDKRLLEGLWESQEAAWKTW